MTFLKNPVVRDVVILVVAALLLSIPFINQAFHLDDRDFIEFSRASAEDPMKFRIKGYEARGKYLTVFKDPHPPLLTTYLSVPLRLGAQVNEVLFHSLYLVFPVIASVSMYSLAHRFTKKPLAAALLLMFTPGCLVVSHTIMGNYPGLAMWLAAAALYIWGVDRDNLSLLAGSAIVMALAIMTAYLALSLIPVMLFYTLFNRRFRFRYLIIPALPLGIYGIWRFYALLRYGHPPSISYSLGTLRYDRHLLAMLVFIGGATVFPLSALVLYLKNKSGRLIGILLILPLASAAALDFFNKGMVTTTQVVIVALLAAAGAMAVYRISATAVDAVSTLRKSREGWADPLFLFTWFVTGVVSYMIFSVSYVSVRHLLLLFPPLVLLFIRETERLWPTRPLLKKSFVTFTLVLTLAVGLLAAVADYRLANLYRTLSGTMGEKHKESGTDLWARGDFGFHYYMKQQGFMYLNDKSEVKPGDIIVTATFPASVMETPWPEGSYSLEENIEIEDSFPVRIMNPWANAGFYGHPMGPLPLAFSSEKLEEIKVYRYLGPVT